MSSYKAILTMERKAQVVSKMAFSNQVSSQDEVEAVLSQLDHPNSLLAALLYNCGIELADSLRLRVRDVNFNNKTITIRSNSATSAQTTERVIALQDDIAQQLKKQIGLALCTHDQDIADGYGRTVLPNSQARKYGLASSDFVWQYVFPSNARSLEPRSGVISRSHLDEDTVQTAIQAAFANTSISISEPSLEHSPAS